MTFGLFEIYQKLSDFQVNRVESMVIRQSYTSRKFTATFPLMSHFNQEITLFLKLRF